MRLRLVSPMLLAALVLVTCDPSFAIGQTFAPGFDTEDPAGAFTPRDRRLQGLLDQARGELSATPQDPRAALQTLQQIIDEAEDVFVDATMTLSLRDEALRILASQPETVRQQYEATYNPIAAALLEAPEGTPIDRQRELVRRYFQTSLGGETAYRRAVSEMDAGRLLSAARLFDRLRTLHLSAERFEPTLTERCLVCYWQGGATRRAATVLAEAATRQPEMNILGEAYSAAAGVDEAFFWLEQRLGDALPGAARAGSQWRVTRGAASRQVDVSPVSPLYDDAWSVPLIGERDGVDPVQVEKLSTLLTGVVGAARDAGWPSIPAMTPLVVGDVVVFSSYGSLKAVGVAEGDFRWVAVPADQTYVDALSMSGGGQSPTIAPEMDDFLIQRAWLDATSAQLSSDGERVYVVRDSGMVGGLPPHFANVAQLNHPRRAKSFNSLRAYDATGGIWKWEIGGERRRAAMPLAGTFFLGPPLPVDGTLYVLGEDLGQVRLHALTPETGAVEWSIPLANADADIEEELDRRLAGLSPTYAGGLLICPTGGGLVVAVDPLLRTLVWGRRYRAPQEFLPQQLRRGPFMAMESSRAQQVTVAELMEQPRWFDGCLIAAGDRLLVAPPDVSDPDDERPLLCLDLLDGHTLWQRARQGALFVGCVHEQTALLVGEQHVDGVDLRNGHTVWTIPLGTSSGRGVRSGHLYHLPLATGELATIDLSAGRLLARSPTRSGQPLGNLIAVAGQLLSQSPTELRSFRALAEVEAQLARDLTTDAASPDALAARGELRLHSGQTADGLNDLRAALSRKPDDRSRRLLATTLLEGLRADFAGYRPHVDELDQLATEPALRSQFLMTYATGLLKQGNTPLAFEQYLRLLREQVGELPMERVDDDRLVRRDRRVQAELARIYAAADERLRTQLDELISRQAPLATDVASRRWIEQLTAAVPGLRAQRPEAPEAPEGTAADPLSAAIQLEAYLLNARRTASADQQASIAAKLVQLYAAQGRAEPLVQLLHELEHTWAESACLEGTTGREWSEAARQSEPVAGLLSQSIHWPTGDIGVREGAGNTTPFSPLRTEGPIDPLTSGFLFVPDNRGQIALQDGYGRPLPEGLLRLLPSVGVSYQTQYVMQQGHRAVLFLGTQFKLVDLLGHTPRVILEDALVTFSELQQNGLRIHQRQTLRQHGFRGQLLVSQDAADNGSVGPLNDSLFCYLSGTTLHAHDPFTGERYWTVDGAPTGSEIFADDEYVLLVPVGESLATLYRALDGEKLGVRKLPEDVERNRRGADWGRHFLRIDSQNGETLFAMYDPIAEENVWERSLPGTVRWTPLDGRDLCLVDESGHMTLLDAATGDIRLEQQVDVPDGLLSLYVLSLPDQWLLTTYRRPAADADSQLAQVQLTQVAQPVNGPVTAFDRATGQVQWSRPIANQMITPGLPSRWPLLALSGIRQETPQVEGQRLVPVLRRHIELIDRQTGETIHAAVTDGNTRRLDNFWHVSPTAPQLRLRYGLLELEVSFREQAVEPPQPAPVNSPADPPADGPADGPPQPPTPQPTTPLPVEPLKP